MKSSLFLRRVLAVAAVAAVVCPMGAAGMTRHPDVSLQTCCDFGQNRGRFAVKELNALQKHLAAQGVTLHYSGGQADFTLPHGMISFEAQGDNGALAAIAPNAIATVQHNGVQNPTFTARYLGAEHSIRYNGIEYRTSDNNAFLLTPAADYKITRLNKLITDVQPAVVFPGVQGATLDHQLIYRSGAGTQVAYDKEKQQFALQAAPYIYITGGIAAIETTGEHNWLGHPGKGEDDSCSGTSWFTEKSDWLTPTTSPLPFAGHEGDSGSPVWWWSDERGRYEFIGTMQGMNGGGVTYYTMASDWTTKRLDAFTKTVTLAAGQNAAITPVVHDSGRDISDPANKVTTHPYEGTVTVAGQEAARFIGLKQGTTYWKNFLPLADKRDWFAYDPKDYTNEAVTVADLFLTENLRFTGEGEHTLSLEEDVDMGIGYVQVSGGGSFTLQGKGVLSSAGFVVDAGTSLTLAQHDEDPVMLREIRKVGEGTLIVAGSGDNRANLMLGGGTTYLRRADGTAAWSVHAANGSTVVLDGEKQVRSEVVLADAVLDLHGHDCPNRYKGFRLTPLTQDSTVTNTAGTATLGLSMEDLCAAGYGRKFMNGETVDTPYKASFTDAPGAALVVETTAEKHAADGTTFSPTHTSLLEEGSAWVFRGPVLASLDGTPTVHGMGSADGKSADRLKRMDSKCVHPNNDWHYADVAAHVVVEKDACVSLGSHARLSGTVQVKQGGDFKVFCPFAAAEEYIEGGDRPEPTAAVAEFAGLKADVTVEKDGRLKFCPCGTPYTYAGRITAAAGSTVVISGGGRSCNPICLSNPNNAFGRLALNGEMLRDTAVRANEVSMVAGNPVVSEAIVSGGLKIGERSKDKAGRSTLTLYATCMAGGTLETDTLELILGDSAFKNGTPKVALILLGTPESPVDVKRIGAATVRVSHGHHCSKAMKAEVVKVGNHTALRVEM